MVVRCMVRPISLLCTVFRLVWVKVSVCNDSGTDIICDGYRRSAFGVRPRTIANECAVPTT